MKTLYYIALHKPKLSKTWTPMMDNRIPVLAASEELCRERALLVLPAVVKDSSNRMAPELHHWEIIVASVCIPQPAEGA